LEDVGPYSIAAQALGFMPTSYAQVLAKNSLGTRIDNAIRTKRTDLLRKLILAGNAGDRAREREVRDEILAFNRRHPRAAITDTVIDRSRASREALNARTNHGLAVSPQNLRYIQSILDDIGPATIGG
jgi:predicted transposase YdaD